ncbi:hypothetical protein JOF29_003569 [Kribbella aluminosa]|uniref:Uncharacterized protein n=1 Tax=Kribbella aluminosa TaxID=416017 RepID=A0ABS4ULG4_9ACTN|nr:hypothetical protein [Kribbella aluminosa]MBP2352486.1 hypothetical protein [Kribbella aluminosa]
MSLPMDIGAADTAHSVAAVRRSSLVMPSIEPLPTSSESRSFQPPGPACRHHSASFGNSRLMFGQAVSAVPVQ